jgi:hypothetical protein
MLLKFATVLQRPLMGKANTHMGKANMFLLFKLYFNLPICSRVANN